MNSLFAVPIFSLLGIITLLVFGFLVLLLFLAITQRLHIYTMLATTVVRNTVLIGFSWWRFWLKKVFLLIGFFLLSLAFLQPRWGVGHQQVQQEVRELFIALDVSRSMLAQDVQPSRLEAAKKKIMALIAQLKTERVGLILFSGSAIVQCPLTTDWTAFQLFLNNVDAQTIGGGTTALDSAIKKSLEAFAQTASGHNKIMVIFTDGEDFSSDLAGIKEKAAQEKLHIFTVGVGTEAGAPIPQFNNEAHVIGHQKDSDGSIVISRLNHGILTNLSLDCGGTYIPLCAENDQDVQTIVSCVERYEKKLLEHQEVHQEQERYYWFAGIAFFCLLLEWLL